MPNVKIPKIKVAKIKNVEIPYYINTPILQGQIPGCSFGHRDAIRNPSLIWGDNNGRTINCPEGQIPSYEPIQYNSESIKLIQEKPKEQEEKEQEGKPNPKVPERVLEKIEPPIEEPCPRPDDLPLFSKNKLQTHRIVKYEKINGECKQILELLPPLEVVNNYIPAPSLIVSTSIVVTTGIVSGALAKDYLLKAIKPTIKKISKKVASIRGKEKTLSVNERRKEQRGFKK